jgi:pyruvate kinase
MTPPAAGIDRRRTKLICTIGPATANRIDELVAVGMDVARINFAHGTQASQRAAALAVRQAAADSGRPVAILTDLAGPKIRLGALAAGVVDLEGGRPFVLRVGGADARPGTAAGAAVSYPGLAADVRIGDPIFLADGAAELRVTGIDGDVRTEVVRGGRVRSGAGVAIPAVRLSAPTLSERDRRDAARAKRIGATYVGLSFVRGAEDIHELRRLLGDDGPRIVAKIETRPAVDAFDAILGVADAVMIARGDLGVEMPFEAVPLLQKQLVRRALDRGVPSIVATQMLESMTAAPRPTRAEASDVANALFDGADAIMLSGETAIGAHPIEAARVAGRIASLCEVEGTAYLPAGMPLASDSETGAITFAAVALAGARDGIAAIACSTRTGFTARTLSALRPPVPVIAFSPDPRVIAGLALVHGVVARPCPPLAAADRMGQLRRLLDESGLVPGGASVVLVSSTATPGSAPNLLGIGQVARGQAV